MDMRQQNYTKENKRWGIVAAVAALITLQIYALHTAYMEGAHKMHEICERSFQEKTMAFWGSLDTCRISKQISTECFDALAGITH